MGADKNQEDGIEGERISIYIRPGRCNSCKHHLIGDYSEEDDYFDHWCDVEENERPGSFAGMHLDHCVFPAASADEVCPAFEMMDLPPPEQN
ncbi:MAG: hypothetical protein E3J65_00780 [Dehalococcoidia bacterium]|nr:MAG: hypothetical protein E3J65_00780 [Dehalococcoidia bacterium]